MYQSLASQLLGGMEERNTTGDTSIGSVVIIHRNQFQYS